MSQTIEQTSLDLVDENNPEVVLKAHLLGAAGPTGSTTQKPTDQGFGTADDGIEPPYDLRQLAKLATTSGVRHACIEAVARNTVGLGYDLVVAPGHEHDTADPREDIHEAITIVEGLARRDWRMGAPTFTDLMAAVKVDEESTGNGYLEVSRDKRTGHVDGLFHLPAARMRRLKDNKGYALLAEDYSWEKATRFIPCGDKMRYNDDGTPTPKLAKAGSARINEVIHFRLYSAESRDYGLPRDIGLITDYLGDKLAADSNVSFFDSSGTPPTVLFVQGEESREGATVRFTVPHETVLRIADTLRSGKSGNRVALVPVPPGTSVKEVQLGQISDRDVGFTQFRQDNKNRFLAAFRLAPIFLADTSSGRYTAEVERAITLEQVFDPEQTRYEAKLNECILREIGRPELAFRFNSLAVENDAARRDSADKMAEVGTITRREHRAAHGYAPLPEAGKVPTGWNDEIINAGKPAGSQDRATFGNDNRGLQSGIGGREVRSTEAQLESKERERRNGAPAVR